MVVNTIDGNLFKSLVFSGYQSLKANMQEINDLNVFPVPDGDTGFNMHKTFENGVKTIKDSSSIGEVSSCLARGALLGARGNSGVILSQYFKGISLYLEGKDEITAYEFAKALISGHQQAYKAVVKPTEGTILTVAREGIDLVFDSIKEDVTLNELMILVYKRMLVSLKETPEKLPVLKEAHVVDSGGAGLIKIFEGFIKNLEGEDVDASMYVEEEVEEVNHSFDPSLFNADSEMQYGYCTEFILQLLNKKCDVKNFSLEELIAFLETLGDSIVAVRDGDIVKVHVHTLTPGVVMNHAQKFGEFITLKIENMAIQNNEVNAKKQEKIHKKVAIVSVSQGDGVEELFKSLNVDVVINGGQTMNTSTEEFIAAFELIDAEDIIVLPNNKNIILAANQASELYKDARIHVLKTSSIAEAYYALNMLPDESSSVEEYLECLNEGCAGVHTGNVTYAVRDTTLNGLSCKKDDFIGILDKNLVSVASDPLACAKGLIDNVDMNEAQAICIFKGQEVAEGLAEELESYIHSKSMMVETIIIDGKQDIYSFILGIL